MNEAKRQNSSMIDLHLHSTFSDGTHSPAELVRMAAAAGLQAISITDHDTAAGTGEAIAAGSRHRVRVVPGVELSVFADDINFHLLGYRFDWRDDRLRNALTRLQDSRDERNGRIIENLRRLGLQVSPQMLAEVSKNGQTGRPHIARLLVQQRIVGTIDQAFDRYLKKGAPCYEPRFIYHASEAIELLHGCGGLAVLAHPGQISRSLETLERVIATLKKLGLDGIETYYPTHSGKFFRSLRSLARSFDLIETGGSDYHGDIRPGTALAGQHGYGVPLRLLERMDRCAGPPTSNETETYVHDTGR